MRIPLGVLLVALASTAAATPTVAPRAPDMAEMPGPIPASARQLDGWVAGFRSRALAQGISAATFDRAMAGVTYLPDVIEKDRNQPEFTRQIWEYLDSAISDTRVSNGRQMLRDHARTLAEVERRYGVEKEVVAAIWGLESAYGRIRGDVPVISALATLALDGRRGRFFEEQLVAALRILQAGDTTSARMVGSWAGAMGHTQFIPTSFLSYAADFDGDGRRDIWSDDPADALASTANYLRRFGWTTGQPWGLEVALPQGFDFGQSGERIKKSVADWTAMGVRDAAGNRIPDHGRASILLPAGARGVALMIFDNFHVIERYNAADAYVIAVGHLSDRLAGGPDFRAGWPREDRALRASERRDLQERLTRAGFDTQGVDGVIGPNTIAAIRAFQRSIGMVPDGYASLEILRRLP
ncbi:MAG: lytic murein transglycosylase [Rhodobacteraceae bacterium]|jgi:membrane-bound lytic murein transglycosylase B|nr:lytic murein transglycosylase [Paracoccaceae bacterium]